MPTIQSYRFENIRTWHGSQDEAFEELCCQLASTEDYCPRDTYRRIQGAGGDGGVECYWLLSNGTEHGWQAKYFFALGSSQWKQIDESVATAIAKHPGLTEYTICLPINRPEGRKTRRKKNGTTTEEHSLMDRWDDHVAAWQRLASGKGMKVEFRYWGNTEIFGKLSLDEHRGRRFFWFSQDELTDEWMARRLEEGLATAGGRYSPDVNVELPVVRYLDAVARTDRFYEAVSALTHRLTDEFSQAAQVRCGDQGFLDSFASAKSLYESLLSFGRDTSRESFDLLNLGELCDRATGLRESAEDCQHRLDDIVSGRKRSQRHVADARDLDLDQLEYSRIRFLRAASIAHELAAFFDSKEARAANTAALFVDGEAGQGKTHLFCDVAASRLREELPTVVLFGEQFSSEEPWSQIVKLLHLACETPEELLGAFDALAQARGRRFLMMIDALNETGNRQFWAAHLGAMLSTLSHYPGIALAVSCRSSYEQLILPGGDLPESLIPVTHEGFSGHEGEATTIFFREYGIEEPAIPLLRPEFTRPLLLKLFCESMKISNLTRIPGGLRGISELFQFFVNSIDKKLQLRMGYDRKTNYVDRSLKVLASLMADRRLQWVPREEAMSAINALLPSVSSRYDETLYGNLVHEGVLVENMHLVWEPEDGKAGEIEVVRAGFEKLTDHIVVRDLLEKHMDPVAPKGAFRRGQPLAELFSDEFGSYQHKGWIEAMAVQIPEMINHELADLVAKAKRWETLQQAFLESLVWRDPTKATEATDKYLDVVFKSRPREVYNTLLMVAGDPKQRYNSQTLHKHLMKQPMPARDSLWSTFLHDHYGSNDAVDRLLNWAWTSDKSGVEDETIELAGIALAWYLSTSHRFVRDRATKALVSMFRSRPAVLLQVLEAFVGVDDLYIAERLYAVAYGVAMITRDSDAVRRLAAHIFETVFEGKAPIPHILLRDYARGVLEVAAHRNVLPADVNLDYIRPPYTSRWPLQIPTNADVEPYKKWNGNRFDKSFGRYRIYSSVMGYGLGDFSHYTIDCQSRWLCQRISEEMGQNEPTVRGFVASLTKRQKTLWDAWQNLSSHSTLYRNLGPDMWKQIWGTAVDEVEEETLEASIPSARNAFVRTLGHRKKAVFERYVSPYLVDPESGGLDLNEARRWILARVFSLGWTPELFGNFDIRAGSFERYGRAGHKPERIGKKYQWIAFHEYLAHVADQLMLEGEYHEGAATVYGSPKEIGIRDIDPSFLIRNDRVQVTNSDRAPWWTPVQYNFEVVTRQEQEYWALNCLDVPFPTDLIEVRDPAGVVWLALHSNFTWREKRTDESDYRTPWREMWCHVRCYLVRRKHCRTMTNWLKNRNFWGKWMPEETTLHDVFAGEFPWAPACNFSEVKSDWTRVARGNSRSAPHPIALTACSYNGISEYDCSVREEAGGLLPSSLLVNLLGLDWTGTGLDYSDHSGRVVITDPGPEAEQSGALLMRKEFYTEAVSQSQYDLVWTILGARELFGNDGRAIPGCLSFSGAYRMLSGRLVGQLQEHVEAFSGYENWSKNWDGRVFHSMR